MAITNYSELQTAVTSWSNSAIPSAIIPDLITLAEARFNRTLYLPQSETSATLTAAATIALPNDFRQLRNLYVDADSKIQLVQVSPSALRSEFPANATGRPRVFAIIDDQIVLGPSPDSGHDVEIVYYATIPALTVGSPTNWLLTAAPDVYLFGALLQGQAYIRDDDAITLWKSALDEAMAELQVAGRRRQYSASPMRLRSAVVV